MKNYITALFVVFSLFFYACGNNEDVIPNEITTKIKPTVQLSDKDSVYLHLSKALAKSISNEQVFETLKQKIDEKIDGDYNTLLVDIINAPVKAGNLRTSSEKTFLECLAEKHESNDIGLRSSTANDFASEITSLTQSNPLIQIAIPLLEEYSDISLSDLQNSVVAFLPEDYQEGVTQWVVGYDAEGNEYTISTETPPDYPVIVISRNERLITVPKGTSVVSGYNDLELVFSTDEYDYYHPQSLLEQVPESSVITRASSGVSLFCLQQLQVTKQYDDWLNGGSEFEFRCSVPLGPSYTTTDLNVHRFELSRSSISDKKTYTYGITRPLNTDWTTAQIQNALKVIETDGGGTKNWTFTLSVNLGPLGNYGINASIPFGSNDDHVYQMVLSRTYILTPTVAASTFDYDGVKWKMSIINL